MTASLTRTIALASTIFVSLTACNNNGGQSLRTDSSSTNQADSSSETTTNDSSASGKWVYVSSFQERLVASANEMNKNCPMTVDKETRLDNCAALPNTEFQWNYTLVRAKKGVSKVDVLKKLYEQQLLTTARTNPDLQVFRDNKTTLIYYFKDKDGVYLFDIKITPEQYSSTMTVAPDSTAPEFKEHFPPSRQYHSPDSEYKNVR